MHRGPAVGVRRKRTRAGHQKRRRSEKGGRPRKTRREEPKPNNVIPRKNAPPKKKKIFRSLYVQRAPRQKRIFNQCTAKTIAFHTQTTSPVPSPFRRKSSLPKKTSEQKPKENCQKTRDGLRTSMRGKKRTAFPPTEKQPRGAVGGRVSLHIMMYTDHLQNSRRAHFSGVYLKLEQWHFMAIHGKISSPPTPE